MSSIEEAEQISEERNHYWKDAWSEWDFVTYVDMIIAKCKRALNCLDAEEEYNERTIDSIMDAMNYAKRLKEVLKDESL